MWPIHTDLGEAIVGTGVTNRPNMKYITWSPTGLLRPQITTITLLVVSAEFWRWFVLVFVVLVLAQNGHPNYGQGYLPLFVAVDKHMNQCG
jgi:hypothetical protein